MTKGDWTTGHIFISHSSRDDAVVAAIRKALEACGVTVWDDAKQLTVGDELEPEIIRALDQSRGLIAVLSPQTINSKWVTKEIRYALNLRQQRGDAYKVVAVMVDGIEPSGLHQAKEIYEAWARPGKDVARRLTTVVDRDLIAGRSVSSEDEAKRQAEANEAATLLLGLPWELLREPAGYLVDGPYPVRVRRSLPNLTPKPALATSAPLRVMLVSPRPEDERASYIDHRVSARPVVEALSSLGELAQFKLLSPPTFEALREELKEARTRQQPYHVVHFDGHGVYSQQAGLGALCFELAEDTDKIEGRRSNIVDATELAKLMHDQRVPLFFLEACQTAVAEKDPTASVAGMLLQRGVASVVAMSHSVLVETARRFVTEFYQELLAGRRIGDAMVAGQRELKAQTFR